MSKTAAFVRCFHRDAVDHFKELFGTPPDINNPNSVASLRLKQAEQVAGLLESVRIVEHDTIFIDAAAVLGKAAKKYKDGKTVEKSRLVATTRTDWAKEVLQVRPRCLLRRWCGLCIMPCAGGGVRQAGDERASGPIMHLRHSRAMCGVAATAELYEMLAEPASCGAGGFASHMLALTLAPMHCTACLLNVQLTYSHTLLVHLTCSGIMFTQSTPEAYNSALACSKLVCPTVANVSKKTGRKEKMACGGQSFARCALGAGAALPPGTLT